MPLRKSSVPPDETVGPIWLGVSSSLLVLLLVTTALRLWARFGRRNLGWDDYTIAIAAITATVRYAFGVMQLPHGNGRHRVYLSDYDYMMVNMYGWWGQLFHFTSMAFLKVSLCLLVLRIQSNKTLRVFLYTVMFGSVIINFAVVIILLAECRPVGFWRENGAQCWPNTIRIYAIWISIAYSVFSDLLCSLLPLTVVWKIKIPSQKKAMVTGLMSIGLVATAFGIVRAQSLSVSEADLSSIWSSLELFLGIAAANLALSRAVYLYFVHPTEDTIPRGRNDPPSHWYIHSGHFESPATMIIQSSQHQGTEAKTLDRDIQLEPWLQDSIKIKKEFWWKENRNPQGPHK
ncbi:integral membrane protein [Colletotrichum incanum]|nr:integral membrane protein [Colletotrichum incanum]